MRRLRISWLLFCTFMPMASRAAETSSFQPDPKSVQRYGPAYRYPQAGWIVLHIEGEPYDRGYQHGRLMGPEIVASLRAAAALQSPKSPGDGWKSVRVLTNTLFVRRYRKEYLEEMKGIADGAGVAGARFEGRPLDLLDIVALNAWPELETLPSALDATATGLEGATFKEPQPEMPPAPKPMHCSAFAATGPATADGRIVFGHITMFSLYPSLFYNVWLDVKPSSGHRVLMQTYPGGIQSGMDYYLNDAGLLVCETTIAQTRFDAQGVALASRIRQALQYADSIDEAVAILKTSNNGLYTNEWLLADTKTNEIAMFELGTGASKLWRSSKHEWFGGTEGFYWGCNNTKDIEVRLETVAHVTDRPANVIWRPSERDKAWLRLYHEHKGKMDARFAQLAFTTPPLAAFPSVDAKFTTSDLAKDLKTWALFGPPLGRTWDPTVEELRKYREIRPLVSNPWTILRTSMPRAQAGAVDVPEKPAEAPVDVVVDDKPVPTVPSWHGTLLPKTDADVWLAAAFADYERIVSLEKALKRQHSDNTLTAEDRDRLAVELYAHRSNYLAAARAVGDRPLAKTTSATGREEWYRIASGKGVLLLHQLRSVHVDQPLVFDEFMDRFGRSHAGKAVTGAEFRQVAEAGAGTAIAPAKFFDQWLNENSGLVTFRLGKVSVTRQGDNSLIVKGEYTREGGSAPTVQPTVTLQTDKGERSATPSIDEGTGNRPSTVTHFSIEVPRSERPLRVILDKYNATPKANGGVYSILSFFHQLDETLIVYGTKDESAAQHETARALQQAIRRRWTNVTVPIKKDTEVTDEELKKHHLLLIGRPDSNRIVERLRTAVPIAFGARSFTVRGETYAHAGSAVIAAGENPLNERYSVVVLAGLSAEATTRTPAILGKRQQIAAEVIVLPHGKKPHALVVPAPELVRELASPEPS